MVEQHFVHFLSPGTFVSEETREKIDSWNPELALEMSKRIKERHGATPYGFQFSTRRREDEELDSSEIERSGMYFIGGIILTRRQIEDRKEPKDDILLANMKGNGYPRVIENCNSWKITLPFTDNDVLIAN